MDRGSILGVGRQHRQRIVAQQLNNFVRTSVSVKKSFYLLNLTRLVRTVTNSDIFKVVKASVVAFFVKKKWGTGFVDRWMLALES